VKLFIVFPVGFLPSLKVVLVFTKLHQDLIPLCQMMFGCFFKEEAPVLMMSAARKVVGMFMKAVHTPTKF
jgi:hypothetical protein